MKTVKIFIEGDFHDGYIYGGQLFLIHNQGELYNITLWQIFQDNLEYNSDEYNFFFLIFSRNNWLGNEQSNKIFKIPGFKENFIKKWKIYSSKTYFFKLSLDKIKKLQKLDATPIFDMKVYGMRLFIGNNKGLYDAGISIGNSDVVTLNNKLDRVSDIRTTHISAKSGSVMLSSNTDGLFHGQLLNVGERLKVKDKPVHEKSVKSSWSGYDLVNYPTQSSLDYLKNEISKTEKRNFLFKDESDTKNISIDVIGKESYHLNDMIANQNFNPDNILHSFNSSANCFFILKDGSFVNLAFRKDNKDSPIRLSSHINNLPKGLSEKGIISRPISSKIIPKGCIIEYFDKIVLFRDGVKQIIETQPATAIKTYPGSVRYKNLITIFTGEGISLHSLFPFY